MTSSLTDSWRQCAAEYAWNKHPQGIALIGNDGKVSAVNPAFEHYVAHSAADLLGMSEATFGALTGMLKLEHRRVAIDDGKFMAIHYICDTSQGSDQTRTWPRIAAMLREPLGNIYGFTELLLTQQYDAETRQELTAILLEQIKVMTNLLNQQFDVKQDRL